MNEKRKGGRPKGSAGPNPLGLIDVATGDQSYVVSRSGAVYGIRDSFLITPAEIADIKERREAV